MAHPSQYSNEAKAWELVERLRHSNLALERERDDFKMRAEDAERRLSAMRSAARSQIDTTYHLWGASK